VICNQQVEPAKDWRSDCLEKQSLLVVELCGVLGRLHSIQGLAQSNNIARLNYSAKHVIKAAGNKVQKVSKGMGGKGKKTQERKQGTWASCGERPNEGNLLSVSPCFVSAFLFFFFFLPRVLKTDNMNTEDLKQQVTTHTFSESTRVFR
jgi:hypothetical protein